MLPLHASPDVTDVDRLVASVSAAIVAASPPDLSAYWRDNPEKLALCARHRAAMLLLSGTDS